MSLVAEGNKGGDRLEIRVLEQTDDTAFLHLKVGSCCVYSINHIVPVELITSLLTIALDYGDVEGKAPEWLEWSDEVNQRILAGISRWGEFKEWWFDTPDAPKERRDAFRVWRETKSNANCQ